MCYYPKSQPQAGDKTLRHFQQKPSGRFDGITAQESFQNRQFLSDSAGAEARLETGGVRSPAQLKPFRWGERWVFCTEERFCSQNYSFSVIFLWVCIFVGYELLPYFVHSAFSSHASLSAVANAAVSFEVLSSWRTAKIKRKTLE